MKKIVVTTAGVALLIIFAAFVWPTPYRDVRLPSKLRDGDAFCCFAARTNRFTAALQVLTVTGWQDLSFTKGDSIARITAAIIVK